MVKVCNGPICKGAERDLSAFGTRRHRGKICPQAYCYECHREYAAQRYWNNPEHYRADSRERHRRIRQETPDVALAEDRRYREARKASPERLAEHREYQRNWYRKRNGVKPDRYRYEKRGEAVERVPTGPLREAVEHHGVGTAMMAYRLGWMRQDGKPDTGRVRANLNRQTVSLSRAKELVEAMGLDPLDVGL